MTTENPVDGFASAKEVATALKELSPGDLLRVKQIAKMRSSGLRRMDWEDLVNESVSRALAGSRRWPRAVPFVAFLAQTIRSVSNDEWRRMGREQVTLESDLASTDADTSIALADLSVNAIDPEREAIAREALGAIETMFAGDIEAIAILRGLAQGHTPDEIQVTASLSATQYSSAQKRIRRCIVRQFLAKEE